MTVEELIAKWERSGGAENANAQPFIIDLCDVLGVNRPAPSEENDAHNTYVFERTVQHVERDVVSTRRIDCYKRDHFILESKQSSASSRRAARFDGNGEKLPQDLAAVKAGMAKRGTKQWVRAMRRAFGQARDYVADLPSDHAAPPFLVIVDVGHVIELYANFSRSGRHYRQFRGPQRFQIGLEELHDPEILDLLRAVWTDPFSLDPSQNAERVTREIADQLATVARTLEGLHDTSEVAGFLMRCLFTMFAQNVKLIPEGSFTQLLDGLRGQPEAFQQSLEHLWSRMDEGGFEPVSRETFRRFNGSLFQNATALPVGGDAIQHLYVAATRNWSQVEPAIFGTLLERALDARERAKLGAHYTPRAFVERLVVPTIIEPLRQDWEVAEARMSELVDAGDTNTAFEVARDFHHQLCTTKVLDPACGTGNFLYVAMELMKDLEGEVLQALDAYGMGQQSFAIRGETVDPSQFYGLEINPRAVPIADLVLWIGYLKGQLRSGGPAAISEPVLHRYGTIVERDAAIEYRERKVRRDDAGEPIRVWDGRSMRHHPVSGVLVPDLSETVETYKFVAPKRAEWPAVDFVIGNPPFLGIRRMRELLGDGYVDALKDASGLPGSVDIVCYWWDHAADLLAQGKIRAFGFISTSSITQSYSRPTLTKHLQKKGFAINFAIKRHPWTDEATAARVEVAFTVVRAGDDRAQIGRLREDGRLEVTDVDRINNALKRGRSPFEATKLLANDRLSFQGVVPGNEGFKLSLSRLPRFHAEREIIDRYIIGEDLTDRMGEKHIINATELDEAELRERFPRCYQHLKDAVYDNRQAMADKYPRRAAEWWKFASAATQMQHALRAVSRSIFVPYTSRHRMFFMLDGAITPDAMAYPIVLPDEAWLAVLSSRVFTTWSFEAGGTLEDRPRFNNTPIFKPFPFPQLLLVQEPTDTQIACVKLLRKLGERLETARRTAQSDNESLLNTELYNVVERVRSLRVGAGEPLSDYEQAIYDDALVGNLISVHDEIDQAVLAAYGWEDLAPSLVGKPGVTLPSTDKDEAQELAEETLLERILELNETRAAEEANGLVRWLRPEYQAPLLQRRVSSGPDGQTNLGILQPDASEFHIWPAKDPRAQFSAVRAVLNHQGHPITPDALARLFKGNARKDRVRQILCTMDDMGIVRSGEKEGERLYFVRSAALETIAS